MYVYCSIMIFKVVVINTRARNTISYLDLNNHFQVSWLVCKVTND